MSQGEILSIWECSERDLTKLRQWQSKMQAEMRLLQTSGVEYEGYYFDDDYGWKPITDLDALLQHDIANLQHHIDRAEKMICAIP